LSRVGPQIDQFSLAAMARFARGFCSGQALHWTLAAVISAASFGGAGASVFPLPSQCGRLVVGCIDDIVNAAYDINQAAADCTLPGLDQLSCAGDLTDMMSYWFNLGNKISTLTLMCGALDNACAANILQALGDISDTSNNLVASAQDCTTDSWLCAYDIVSAIDTLNAFTADIIYALQTCNQGALPPADINGYNFDFNLGLAGGPPDGQASVDGGYYIQRRLTEEDASAEAVVEESTANATASGEFDSAVSDLQAGLSQLRARIEKQKEEMIGTEGTEEERKAAWKSLVERVRSSQKDGTVPAARRVNLTDAAAEKLQAAAAKVAEQVPLLKRSRAKEIHV